MTESHIRLYETITMTDKLSDSEKILYGLIYRFKDQPDGCYMSNKTIGRTLAWDERKIQRVLCGLRKKNLVRYETDGHSKKIWANDNPDIIVVVEPDEPRHILTSTPTLLSPNPDSFVAEPRQFCHPIKEESIKIKEAHTPTSSEEPFKLSSEPISKARKLKTLPIPTVDEVIEYINNHPEYGDVEPEAFWNHYEARGWKYGKGIDMKNWKAAVRTWHFNGRKQHVK
jgi:hypothetical protein